MKRPIALTREDARHPYRRSLPAHVMQAAPMPDTPRSSDHDWKLFVLSFTAFFIAAYSFIF